MSSLIVSLSQSRSSHRSSSPAKERPVNQLTDDSEISDIDLDTPHTSFESRATKSQNVSGRSERSFDKSSPRQSRQSLARFHDSSRDTTTSSSRQKTKNRSYVRLESDLREKQREIATLESIVEELNGELQSSQAKLSNFIEKSQQSRDHQRQQMEQWRRDQLTMMVSPESYAALNEKLAEAAAQLDAVHEERAILVDELERYFS